MEGKTRFVECVINWIRCGSFEDGRRYHWFWGDGSVRGECYSVEFRKKRFKRVVVLYRWVEEDTNWVTNPVRKVGYKIPITTEEADELWNLQDVIESHVDKKMEASDKKHEEKMERLQWYP